MIPHIGKAQYTASDLDKAQKRRQGKILLFAVVLCVILTAVLILLKGNLLIPVGIMLSFVLLGVAWQFPRSMYFIMLAGACLIETYPQKFKDSITDDIPLFWDINTIVQTYLKVTNFHGVAFSFFELLLILAGLSWLIRGVFNQSLSFKSGTLLIPIMLYVLCVLGGLFNGLATGGTFNIAFFEVRAQFYFLFAYLIAVNSARDPEKQMAALLWVTALTIGLKGLLCSFRFIVTLKGMTIPEIGIGEHDESFFFDCFMFELMVLKLADIQPKLRGVMLFMLPFVILANLANQRRAATAAFAIAIIIMLVLAAAAFPKRRAAIGITSIIIVLITSIYLPLYWNKTGSIAQPARAIKSQFTPDQRDQSSNEYRDAENANLMETLKVSPIFGYGYGKPILLDTEMVDLTDIDPLIHYMTHNQILWVWMRVGTIGFYFFWLMITGIIIQGCHALRNYSASLQARAAALLGVLIIVMQMVFGLLDLQISNVRNMLFCGLWAGLISVVSTTYPGTDTETKATPEEEDRAEPQPVRWKFPQPEQLRS